MVGNEVQNERISMECNKIMCIIKPKEWKMKCIEERKKEKENIHLSSKEKMINENFISLLS